jgi:hypothetical protein
MIARQWEDCWPAISHLPSNFTTQLNGTMQGTRVSKTEDQVNIFPHSMLSQSVKKQTGIFSNNFIIAHLT